jgi:CRISPR system Cascade subunit CasD
MIRDTAMEPSKSGVIGLLCAALGKPRDLSTIEDAEFRQLIALKMAVRVDREGIMRVDYHTAQNVAKAGGGTPKETEISQRYYLSDACFVVTLEGEEALLQRLNIALAAPYWQLSLGRKAFLPSRPIPMSNDVHSLSMLDLLKDFQLAPWQGNDGGQRTKSSPPDHLRIVFDTAASNESEVRHDLPLSFAWGKRRFLTRYVQTMFIETPKGEQ